VEIFKVQLLFVISCLGPETLVLIIWFHPPPPLPHSSNLVIKKNDYPDRKEKEKKKKINWMFRLLLYIYILQFIWIAGCPEQSCSICSSSTLS
jgi:hypothetical protein